MAKYNTLLFKSLAELGANYKKRRTIVFNSNSTSTRHTIIEGKFLYPNQIIREFGSEGVEFEYETGVGNGAKSVYYGKIGNNLEINDFWVGI